MIEDTITVRAKGERGALAQALRVADGNGFYVLRVVSVNPVGPWTEGDDGSALWDVVVLGDREPESVMRAMDGDR